MSVPVSGGAALRIRAPRLLQEFAVIGSARRPSADTGRLPDGDALEKAVASFPSNSTRASTPPLQSRRLDGRRGRFLTAWPAARNGRCGAGSARSSRPRRSPAPWSSSPLRRSCAPRTASRPPPRTSKAISRVADEVAVELGEPRRPVRSARSTTRRRCSSLALVADRGLCGGYNANVLRAVERTVRAPASRPEIEYRIVTSGKKAPPYLRFRGIQSEQSFTGMSDRPTFEDARSDRRSR